MSPLPLTPEEIRIGLAITVLMVFACLYGIHLGGTWEEKRLKKRSRKSAFSVISSELPELSFNPQPDPWAKAFEISRIEPTQFNSVENICKARALAHAADAQSSWTEGQSERVTYHAVNIGKQMGLSSKEIETLKIAGFMHDIGRIGTYDILLDKQAEITGEEFELIKKHPGRSAEIVESIEQLQGVSQVVRHHHERIDGKGYPDNLKGDAIPLLARIIYVAAAFDSMTSARPYRLSLGKDYAIEQLHKFAGSQFDYDVVQAFLIL